MKLGSHVGMSGKEMFLGSAKEAVSYGADTFMIYTGAPQNSRRKPLEELNIDAGWEYLKENGIREFVVHAPYIINLGNCEKAETFDFAVETLKSELIRTDALKSNVLILHPGSHLKATPEEGLKNIIKGINLALDKDTKAFLALETMAGKGSELGKTFEELAVIFEGVKYNDRLRVCFDTCHTNDAGYDLTRFDEVIEEFDRIIGKEKIAAFHINDSMNDREAHKDRHENIGFGTLGFDVLNGIVHHPDFAEVPMILETPYLALPGTKEKVFAPYKWEIEMLRKGTFDPDLKKKIMGL